MFLAKVNRVLTLGVCVAALVACGPRSEEPPAATGSPAATAQTPHDDAADTAEYGEGHELPSDQTGEAVRAPSVEDAVQIRFEDFRIEMPATLPAGSLMLEVSNEGSSYHNLAVEKAHESPASDLEPGKHRAVGVTLEPGNYRFYCTVQGHAEKGESLQVQVVPPAALQGSPAVVDGASPGAAGAPPTPEAGRSAATPGARTPHGNTGP